MGKLNGRIAVVTGAAQGIGRAITERLVEEGAYVLCADRNPSIHEVSAALGGNVLSLVVDVSSDTQVSSMIKQAYERWGRLDILCNNAGIDGHSAVLAECSEADFEQIIGVNLKGVFLGMKYAIPLMLEAGGGSIINTSSAAGLVGFPTQSIYAASKHGVIGMTKVAALEYGPSAIRVNAICPGGVLTPLAKGFIEKAGGSYEQWAVEHPLKRFAEAEEIAALVAFLASDDSRFITGTAIPIDGGYTAK